MKRDNGATLVELMVAMVIMLIVSLGFFSWLDTVMRMNLAIERSNTAYAMANDVADRLQRMNDNALIQAKSGNAKYVGYDAADSDTDGTVNELNGCSGANPSVNLNPASTPNFTTLYTNPNAAAGKLYLYDTNACSGQTWIECRAGTAIDATANASIDHPNSTGSTVYDSINPIRSYKGTTYYAVWSVAYMPCNASGTDRRKIFITVYWIDPEPTAATAAAALSGTIIKGVSLVADKTIGAET